MSLLLAILVSLGLGSLVALSAGENPIQVFSILFQASFGSLEGLGYTIFYSTPLIFTGLAVAVPYSVGFFNIGGEGQLYMGALISIAVLPIAAHAGFLAPVVLIVAAAIGGALWSGLVGLMKAWRGCHEVIATIMLNFIAMSLANYCI